MAILWLGDIVVADYGAAGKSYSTVHKFGKGLWGEPYEIGTCRYGSGKLICVYGPLSQNEQQIEKYTKEEAVELIKGLQKAMKSLEG